jgi:RNA polymerase sigma factor (sigma-70 family)
MQETTLSLLERARSSSDEEAWRHLIDLYSPLIRNWLSYLGLQLVDQDDLVQEVLVVVVRELPGFRHGGQPGSFRAWLRVLVVNRAREFWRARNHRPLATGDSDFGKMLAQLEEPQNELVCLWDQEHDRHLVRRLLELAEPAFEPATREAFRQVVVEGKKASVVAAELGLSVNAVLLAKSRVLRRLRRELDGLLD